MKRVRRLTTLLILISMLSLGLATSCSTSKANNENLPTSRVAVSLPGQSGEFTVDSRGAVKSLLDVSSADGRIRLSLNKNTVALDKDGKPLNSISAGIDSNPPAPPQNAVIVSPVYSLGPEGATFDPWFTLTVRYDTSKLPGGANEPDLLMAYYSGTEWRIPSYRKVNTTDHTVTTQIYHFSSFAVLAARDIPVEGLSTGNLAPDFRFQGADGKPTSLSALRGRAVIINFWSIDCPPCIEEMPLIQKVHEKWSGKGLVVLAVNLDDKPRAGEIQKFMSGNGYTFQVVLDPSWQIGQSYRIREYPTTFYIDKAGIIRLKRIGAFVSVSQMEDSLNRIMP